MPGTVRRIAGPAYLAASATNVYTPAASTIYTVIRHIHIANKDSSARTFTLYVGATGGSAAGTELFKDVSVAVAGYFDWYGLLRMDSTDFLTGIASAATALVIVVEGEYTVV
jgi:hypothetical protein